MARRAGARLRNRVRAVQISDAARWLRVAVGAYGTERVGPVLRDYAGLHWVGEAELLAWALYERGMMPKTTRAVHRARRWAEPRLEALLYRSAT